MGDAENLCGTTGKGVVFKITYCGNHRILTQLGGGDIGMTSSVVVDSNGVVHGTDPGSADYTCGAAFEITQLQVKHCDTNRGRNFVDPISV
jgi:hypothetical protein